MVDAAEGVLGIEWIDGSSVRLLLGGGAEGEAEEELAPDENPSKGSSGDDDEPEDYAALMEYGVTQGYQNVLIKPSNA